MFCELLNRVTKKDWKVREREREVRNNQRFERRLAVERRKAKERKKRHQIKEVHNQNRYANERKRKFTTSKLLMYLILLNCSIVEIYSMWVMYRLQDLSALYTLITAVIGESIAYAIYSAKSYNETKEEAKSNLERDKFLFESGMLQPPTEPTEPPDSTDGDDIEIVG